MNVTTDRGNRERIGLRDCSFCPANRGENSSRTRYKKNYGRKPKTRIRRGK